MLGRRPKRRSEAPLGAWSVLGAWLRIWTSPRGVDVPPVPVRSLAVAALVIALVIAGGALVAYQRIAADKRAAEAEQRRASAVRSAAERRRVALEQRPMRGRAPSAPASSSPAQGRRARRSLLDRLERAIAADARARLRAGTLPGRAVLDTSCEPFPATAERARAERAMSAPRAAYACVAVTTRIPGVVGLGHPFRAVVDYERSSYVWCKVNPVAGERAVPDPRRVVRLSPACAG